MAQKPSVISGVVRDAQGQTVEGARVYFVDGPVALPEIAALTGSDGRFSLAAPSPGRYEVECATDDAAPVRVAVTVTGGAEARVDIKLKG